MGNIINLYKYGVSKILVDAIDIVEHLEYILDEMDLDDSYENQIYDCELALCECNNAVENIISTIRKY